MYKIIRRWFIYKTKETILKVLEKKRQILPLKSHGKLETFSNEIFNAKEYDFNKNNVVLFVN